MLDLLIQLRRVAVYPSVVVAALAIASCSPQSDDGHSTQDDSATQPNREGSENATISRREAIDQHSTQDDSATQPNREGSENATISRQEAIDQHWSEIGEDLNGSSPIEACSDVSGSCDLLEADIDDGAVSALRSLDGGYMHFDGAGIDDTGSASGTTETGNGWTFKLDMDSPIVDHAIKEWSESRGYRVQFISR